jgi:cell division protein FtsI/penicillin-binding protein 2
MGSRTRYRLVVLSVILAICAAAIVAQLVRLQVVDHQKYRDEVDWEEKRTETVVPLRGRIWDRSGNLLADNVARFQVVADVGVDINEAVQELAPVLKVQPGEMRAKLASANQQVVLATDLPMATGRLVSDLQVGRVFAVPYWRRAYPERQLASHVLGFVNAEPKGYYGVEQSYDALLAGRREVVLASQTAWFEPSPSSPLRLDGPRPGVDLVLTIDRTFQALAEAELERALAETGARSGTIVVMDPRTGAILAMANAPAFDPNRFTETPAGRFANPAASVSYEPGSVFKILTMAAALQEGRVTPDTVYNDTACIEVGGWPICNWDRKAHGPSTMVDLLAHSLNVGAARLSTQMGGQTFYRYAEAFGIGKATGIDLGGEEKGSIRTPDDLTWHESDLGTNAFGQGLSVTPIQMLTAVAAVANGGVMMRPHVVAQMIDGNQVMSAKPASIGRPISGQTARTLTEMLEKAIQRELQLQVPGYRIAGKSGTAQIPIPGGYDDPWTIASFVGWGPVSDPRLIILVKLDRPTSSPYGGQTAAPVFARLASRMFVLMGVPPDNARALAGGTGAPSGN